MHYNKINLLPHVEKVIDTKYSSIFLYLNKMNMKNTPNTRNVLESNFNRLSTNYVYT